MTNGGTIYAGQVSAPIIPADRLTPWQPGVTYNGGIPNRTTIFTTLSPIGGGADDTSQINTAISNAGAQAISSGTAQVVKLNAGVFNINGNGIFWTSSNVTLRGSGLQAAAATGGVFPSDVGSALNYVSGTWLVKKDRDTQPGAGLLNIFPLGEGFTNSVFLAQDAVLNSNQCVLQSNPGLSVGDMVWLDHNTDQDPNVFWGGENTSGAFALGGPAGAEFFASSTGGTTLTVTSMIYGTIPAIGTTGVGLSGENINPGNFIITAFGTGTGGVGTYTTNGPIGTFTNRYMACGYPTRRQFYRQERSLCQIMKITGISGVGNTIITFETPFHSTFKTGFPYNAQLTQFSVPFLTGVGIEDLGLFGGRGGDGHGNMNMNLCANSWVKHVESYWSQGVSLALYYTYRCEIRDSFMHEGPNINPGGDGYLCGIHTGSAENLVENCIMWCGNKVMVVRGSGGGNVIGYCYTDDAFGSQYPQSPEAGVNAGHQTTPHMELIEGNYSFAYKGDSFWGASIYITVFRNWLSGLRAKHGFLSSYTYNDAGTIKPYGDYEGRIGVDVQAGNYYTNFVGNVLGTSGQSLLSINNGTYSATQDRFLYEQLDTFATGNPVVMWQFGADTSHQGIDGNNGWTSTTYQTQLRQGNWDWFTQTQKWHGIGGSVQYGANPAAPFPSMPTSFYMTTKPAFFTTNPWPWVDPTNGSTTTLPAKARFDNNTPNTVL